jgi:hypothetical protein
MIDKSLTGSKKKRRKRAFLEREERRKRGLYMRDRYIALLQLKETMARGIDV